MNLRPALLALLCASSVHGRDWHGTQVGRIVTGEFVKISAGHLWIRTPHGQPIQIKMDLVAPDDQAYASAAQAATEEGEKLGPQSFEVTLTTPVGSLCRMATKMGNGSTMFTGEQFMLLGETSTLPKSGTRFADKILFAAGLRTFHPIQGPAIPLRTFSLTLNPAAVATVEVKTGRKTTDIYEPKIEISESLTLGYAVSASNVNDGLILVDATALIGAKSIDVDLGKEHTPGTLIAINEKLSVAVIACKGTFEPTRLAPKKSITLGQPILAVSYALNSTKKGLGDTSVTKGIVSKFNERSGHFEHDALVAPGTLGGVVLSEKGDVVGVMVQRPLTKEAEKRAASPAANLTLCVYTETLVPWLNSVPKVPLQRATLNFNLQDTTDTLKRSAMLVRITRETIHEVIAPPPVATPPGTPTATTVGAAGWSISKAGIRHSSKCRYFNANFPCQATDGTACKVCGG